MSSYFKNFFLRFRKSPYNPRHPRTMAQSQLEDQDEQMNEPEVWKAFHDDAFENGQDALPDEQRMTFPEEGKDHR